MVVTVTDIFSVNVRVDANDLAFCYTKTRNHRSVVIFNYRSVSPQNGFLE